MIANSGEDRLAPTISAVIPCYNAAPFLRETIESVLNQTTPPLEVIIVDDGSTDSSASIAESYGPKVRVIRQVNQGESVARNRGIDEAKGEWVALLDADDRWLPQKLERQITALQSTLGDVVCVYSDFIVFGSVPRQSVSRPMWPEENEQRVRLLTNPVIQPGTALIRTSVARQVRFPEGISDGEDQVFWMLLYDHGKVLHIPESLIEYRKYFGQQTSRQGHGVRVIGALWRWAVKNSALLSEMEYEILCSEFEKQLMQRHDNAFWESDFESVKAARSLYNELLPNKSILPPLFSRDTPTTHLRIAHDLWNGLLGLCPMRVRQGLSRICRPILDGIKRGRVSR